jgi:hypothetical protein
MYRRDRLAAQARLDAEQTSAEFSRKGVSELHETEKVATAAVVPVKRSFVSGLRLYSGVYTKESFWKLAARPVALLLLPSVFWATLVMVRSRSTFLEFQS